jgi:hypothetical protein
MRIGLQVSLFALVLALHIVSSIISMVQNDRIDALELRVLQLEQLIPWLSDESPIEATPLTVEKRPL